MEEQNPGWGVLPYISYVGTVKCMVFELFWYEKGIDFAHYGLISGIVFKGTTREYKNICLFNSK